MISNFNFYYPSIEGGGLEKNLFSLVNSLAEKKYKINFFTYENNTNTKKFKKKYYFHKNINLIIASIIPGIRHRYIKYLFCIIRLFIFSISNRGIIVSFQGNILSIIVAKITFNKIIIRCNTAPSKYIDSYLKKIFFKYFYSLSDLILVTSKDFKKEIKKYFGLNSCVHRQSLDIEEINKKSKIKFNFPFFEKYNGLKIINIGRLTYQKDQMTLLKSFAKLVKSRNARLLLIGSGSDKNDLIDFINEKKINNSVKIIPYTSNPFKYISLCNLKVLSSRYEGNPNILLEIASLKKLIVSSNCKVGPREILQSGKGGILFKVSNDKQLYLILKKIKINSIKMKKKIETSYKYVKNNFQRDISDSFIYLISKL
ncbi:glycosyltransferase [Candidatus Pelagibacter sp.]|jgi:glycosyltransferase involved in cell wall biosynthesis|nr:glycosyltransferase [Candidatus Pelagibacter sp.]